MGKITNTVNGTYGSQMTPCRVYTVEKDGGLWYAVEGSQNVNFTYDAIEDGVDVEFLVDVDATTSGWEIDSEMSLFLDVNGEELDAMEG